MAASGEMLMLFSVHVMMLMYFSPANEVTRERHAFIFPVHAEVHLGRQVQKRRRWFPGWIRSADTDESKNAKRDRTVVAEMFLSFMNNKWETPRKSQKDKHTGFIFTAEHDDWWRGLFFNLTRAKVSVFHLKSSGEQRWCGFFYRKYSNCVRFITVIMCLA